MKLKITEANLNPQEQSVKMDLWHTGARKENVGAMGDAKLEMNYNICVKRSYTKEANILKQEGIKRGLSWATQLNNPAQVKTQAKIAAGDFDIDTSRPVLTWTGALSKAQDAPDLRKKIGISGTGPQEVRDMFAALVLAISLDAPQWQILEIRRWLEGLGYTVNEIKDSIQAFLKDPDKQQSMQAAITLIKTAKKRGLLEELHTPELDEVNQLIQDIYDQRKQGLAADGEFSQENLLFKEFRNRGYLDNLKNKRDELVSKELTLAEDTTKLKDHKWTNQGKEGKHGTFRTKKEADAQRKAMYANGFTESFDERKRRDYAAQLSRIAFNQAIVHDSGMFEIYQVKANDVDRIMEQIRALDFVDSVQKAESRYDYNDFQSMMRGGLPSKIYKIYGRIKDTDEKLYESRAEDLFAIDGFEAQVTDEFEDDGVKGYYITYSRNGQDIVTAEIWEEDSPITVVENYLYSPNLFERVYDSFEAFAADVQYKYDRYVK